jgi:FMN phosphatase YigB (HAD superfamily)
MGFLLQHSRALIEETMALTLEQYAEHLDARTDLFWPAPPEIKGTKSKPFLRHFPQLKAVTWNVYGTLLAITGGEFHREHPNPFVMEIALDKTIQEFKMWKSMSRKPGQPAALLRTMLQNVTAELNLQVERGERYPEIPVEKVWEAIIKKLLQNEYVLNSDFYGPLDQFAEKIAYFYHRSLQGTGCDDGAAQTVQWIKSRHYWQGLLTDGQCFTAVQLQRGLASQDPALVLDYCIPPSHRSLSHVVRARKPSERLYRDMVHKLRASAINPEETLHISSDVPNDLFPAKRQGFVTCLFTGDKSALRVPADLANDKLNRPDLMITDFRQVMEILSGQPL